MKSALYMVSLVAEYVTSLYLPRLHTHTYTLTHSHSHTHTHTHTCTYTHTHTHTHTYTHMHVHTHAHTYTHTLSHTHCHTIGAPDFGDFSSFQSGTGATAQFSHPPPQQPNFADFGAFHGSSHTQTQVRRWSVKSGGVWR